MERDRGMSQRLELPGPILDARVVPVARGLDGDSAVAVSDALVSGGIPLIEVTIEGASGFGRGCWPLAFGKIDQT